MHLHTYIHIEGDSVLFDITHGDLKAGGFQVRLSPTARDTWDRACRFRRQPTDRIVGWIRHPAQDSRAARFANFEDLDLIFQESNLWSLVRLYIIASRESEQIPTFSSIASS